MRCVPSFSCAHSGVKYLQNIARRWSIEKLCPPHTHNPNWKERGNLAQFVNFPSLPWANQGPGVKVKFNQPPQRDSNELRPKSPRKSHSLAQHRVFFSLSAGAWGGRVRICLAWHLFMSLLAWWLGYGSGHRRVIAAAALSGPAK